MNPEETRRLEANTRAFLEPDVDQELKALLQGLRPFSASTLVMMQQTKNEWLKRLPVAQMQNRYFATLGWLYIQSAPENEVRRMVWSENLFRESVLAWANESVDGKPRISSQILAMADAIIENELGLIEEAHVSVLAKPGEKPEAAPPNS